jgi:hypothetical protein
LAFQLSSSKNGIPILCHFLPTLSSVTDVSPDHRFFAYTANFMSSGADFRSDLYGFFSRFLGNRNANLLRWTAAFVGGWQCLHHN